MAGASPPREEGKSRKQLKWEQSLVGPFAFDYWTTATRPTTQLVIGRAGFNTDLNVLEIWNGAAWV